VASVGSDSGGRKRILFVAGDGRRKTIRLGKMSKRQAESAKRFIEDLIACQVAGTSPKNTTAEWLAAAPDRLRKRLAAVSLLTVEDAPEPEPTLALGAFLDAYLAGRVDLKPSTHIALGQTVRFLVKFFGPDKPLRDIRPGDADLWRLFLIGRGLADNTVRRRSGAARQFFRAAVRRGLVTSNPFADLTAAVQGNPARDRFITRDVAQAVLDACPGCQWRLIFALARFGGLRIPSELMGLTWADIHWAEARFTVHSPKTEHHPGKATREVPLFPELVPHLREAFEQAEPGTEHVITSHRHSNANLSTQLRRILRRAGIEPWPKLFQNLRATRQTELAEHFPMHVVCAWIGNSRAIALEHYLQVTADHYRRAAQIPAQYLHVSSGTERKAETADVQKRPGLPQDSEPYESVHINQVGVTGLEPVTSSL